jgi:acetyl esterase/lipase
MSFRGELLRIAVRATLKQPDDRPPDANEIRARLDRYTLLAPRPPKGVRTERSTVGGVPSMRVTDPDTEADKHVLYLHGGAYCHGRPSHYRDFIWRIARRARASVHVLDYRLAPEHPFPAAIDDAVGAYKALLAAGADPKRVVVMGDSAGGGLTFASLLRLRDEGAPMPAVAVAMSPWTDLTLGSKSASLFARTDPMLSVGQARVFARWYAGTVDLRHPYISPVYGDPTGLPPALIQVGSDEILRDDTVRMTERLRKAGVEVQCEVWPRMPHVWQMFARLVPESRLAIDHIGAFMRRRLGIV